MPPWHGVEEDLQFVGFSECALVLPSPLISSAIRGRPWRAQPSAA